MDARERYEAVRSSKSCFRCLSTGHSARNCRRMFKCRINGCDQPHHDLLHEAYDNDGNTFLNNHTRGNEEVLLQIQKVRCMNNNMKLDSLNILWDSGSTLSFITFKKAHSIKLKGTGHVNLQVTKIGKMAEAFVSQKYILTLLDNHDNQIEVNVFGIDKISNDIKELNIDNVMNLFPRVKGSSINRPAKGEIDCLNGFDMADYHPVKRYEAENLLILGNQFGYVIGGSHPNVLEKCERVVKEVNNFHMKVDDFYRTEQLGVEVFPKCCACAVLVNAGSANQVGAVCH